MPMQILGANANANASANANANASASANANSHAIPGGPNYLLPRPLSSLPAGKVDHSNYGPPPLRTYPDLRRGP